MSVTYKGRTYPTIATLAIAYGLTADACASRLRRGRPFEEPLRTVLPVSYAGHKYPSIEALARACAGLIRQCSGAGAGGAPLDPAVTLSKKKGIPHRGRRCRYNGQEYQSVSAMARALGLTYSTACALCEETQ